MNTKLENTTSENFEKAGGDPLPDQHLHRLHHRQLSYNKDHPKCLGDCSQVRKRLLQAKPLFSEELFVEQTLV